MARCPVNVAARNDDTQGKHSLRGPLPRQRCACDPNSSICIANCFATIGCYPSVLWLRPEHFQHLVEERHLLRRARVPVETDLVVV